MNQKRIARRIARDLFLRRFRLERSYRPPALLRHPDWNFDSPLELSVAHVMRVHPDLAFLQVGAFDGLTNDPIRPLVERYGLRGVVVEPQAGAFEALRSRYAAHSRVTVVNAAISDANGVRDLYTTAGSSLQTASFDKAHLLKHKVPSSQIVSQKVRCLTIATLLEEVGLAGVDLVQIDAEGYDYQIIRTIDFGRLRPSIIRFEHAHLADRDCDECVELLASHGYRFISERRDLIALRLQ